MESAVECGGVVGGGKVEETEGARRRRCFDSETRASFTSITAEATPTPPASRTGRQKHQTQKEYRDDTERVSSRDAYENGPYLLVRTAFPYLPLRRAYHPWRQTGSQQPAALRFSFSHPSCPPCAG